jgi:hypothetical protein
MQSEPTWLLTPEQVELLQQLVVESHGADKSKLISRLPKPLTPQQLMYYLNTTG